ncbi:bifunctional cystathionine gamma-lyase/homocysteine desulfhydrase [Brevibacillus laterosporus]|uniref:Bifunctional cystathionine gamma-lyase/homocysteine desulfhydrase n=1 Tax=Brevibacillus laterosporus TaxID=1465 RepID=A0AAP3DCY4_BRELA|nr:bifunctional cystathionine gamma-lyase/homocysteine desulfhydrase [Brevibacillus laterosporus]MCR8978591.1 bifunctional cystathionine gamma-lyase/homocysteine desulfhydrase [Brevibacillus laterosporus]MCZ0805747.1 bifunctional cystathionine gamma-lyase/homocysteine desulfhydrase [Brevibacillus laterosporus]MCZ0824487.1 bifunctional cystathionine gamma-lyase/homocysteine desulfhydrase [Brevibacillus laterosporus]MCZ0848391.1 bifunctional cystathionine gamma-lyase/homocysteine desulfhydrase [B
MKMKTRLIHGGIEGDIHTGAVSTPIYQVSTYKQEGIGVHKGYEYSRTGNPTRHALETYMADLEGGARGLAFGSGMAALSTVLSLCSQGDHLVVGDDVYGGTYRVITRVFSKLGLEATYVDTTDLAAVEKALRPNTRMIIMETPTNPLLNVSDVRAVAAIAKSKGVLLVVDNTFMTPYWQNPLDLGADIVFHSATKYLGGHSDVVAGIVVTKEAELGEQLHFQQNAIGAILGPQDSWLLLRGAKTLGIRMEEHEKNANQLAHWLQEQASISRVLYPGLASHPGHEQMKKQARGFGGMISFDVGSDSRAEEVLSKLKYFTLAESLGAVESLIGLPARMTHASIPAERRAELGITDGLLRISVGIEDVEDLMEDLEQALS